MYSATQSLESPSIDSYSDRGRFHELLDRFDQADSTETIRVTQEEPWDSKGEDLLCIWLASTEQEASKHRTRGFRLKRLYKIFGILSIVSAAIVFFCSNIDIPPDTGTESFVRVFVSFLNLIIANLVSFLDYGPKYQKQFEFEGRYLKVSVDIKSVLASTKDYRPPKDRTLAEYKERIANLYANAPEV